MSAMAYTCLAFIVSLFPTNLTSTIVKLFKSKFGDTAILTNDRAILNRLDTFSLALWLKESSKIRLSRVHFLT